MWAGSSFFTQLVQLLNILIRYLMIIVEGEVSYRKRPVQNRPQPRVGTRPGDDRTVTVGNEVD